MNEQVISLSIITPTDLNGEQTDQIDTESVLASVQSANPGARIRLDGVEVVENADQPPPKYFGGQPAYTS